MSTKFDYVVTTGDFISEWIEDEGINAAELGRRLGVTSKHVSELLDGKAPLSHQLAIALERVTGVPARLWSLYESGYRSALAREVTQEDLAVEYVQAKEFPLTYLRKFGFITANSRDHAGTVDQLLRILRVASFDAFWATWTHGSVAYRRSAVGRVDFPALSVWLALAEQHNDQLHSVPNFDRAGLQGLIPVLRGLTRGNLMETIHEAQAKLHSVGVVLCFIPPVPGLGIHGATRWLNGTPVIQLSGLWQDDDQLWFTLFHEIGHVLLHGDKGLYLNSAGTAAEHEADTYASEILIPSEWQVRLPRKRNVAAVKKLAGELGIAPSIVLAHTQRHTSDFAWGQGLRQKFEWVAKP